MTPAGRLRFSGYNAPLTAACLAASPGVPILIRGCVAAVVLLLETTFQADRAAAVAVAANLARVNSNRHIGIVRGASCGEEGEAANAAVSLPPPGIDSAAPQAARDLAPASALGMSPPLLLPPSEAVVPLKCSLSTPLPPLLPPLARPLELDAAVATAAVAHRGVRPRWQTPLLRARTPCPVWIPMGGVWEEAAARSVRARRGRHGLQIQRVKSEFFGFGGGEGQGRHHRWRPEPRTTHCMHAAVRCLSLFSATIDCSTSGMAGVAKEGSPRQWLSCSLIYYISL